MTERPQPHVVPPTRAMRWWIPVASIATAVILVAVTVGWVYAPRVARRHCLFASQSFEAPRGWKRVDGHTFRRGVVEGTIARIVVPTDKDVAELGRFYQGVVTDEQRRVGSNEQPTITPAHPLHGNVGTYASFTYRDGGGRSIKRIDHIMHPRTGGCGWHFRAAYRTYNDAPGDHDAARMPNNFSFAT